jgi:large subunit ribosomal protein L9
MKIILKQEVTGLGAPGDIVEVKDGYGRNYLLPQGMAITWTKGAEKQITLIKRARSARDIRDLGHASEVRTQLESLNVKLPVRAGEGGRLYGSVTPAEVVAAVRKAGGPELDRRRLELPGVLKSVGDHKVRVKLHPEVSATFTLSIVAANAK